MSRKIRVRIAVAATDNGKWFAYGDDFRNDATKALLAGVLLNGYIEKPRITFVEAEVFLPDLNEQTIEGEVKHD